jgi:hypothetical protein
MSIPDHDLSGPVPDDNLPGHHPDREQDKPDLDDFAERLGVPPEASTSDHPLEAAPGGPSRLERQHEVDVTGAEVETLAPVADIRHPGPYETTFAAPAVEVRDAVWDFGRASIRLFVVTPVKVGWHLTRGVLGIARAHRSSSSGSG